MKALSIKQPWAHLIASGIKDIENRTWKTHFRGRIYIHASAKIANVHFTSEQISDLNKNNISVSGAGYQSDMLVVSAIIGEVDIVDCVINHTSIWAEQTPFARSGNQIFYPDNPIYNWVLANPILYDKPILNVKGKLSFWEPTPNQECMMCGEMYFGHDPIFCCRTASADCGCLGMPIYPSICSDKCGEFLMSK